MELRLNKNHLHHLNQYHLNSFAKPLNILVAFATYYHESIFTDVFEGLYFFFTYQLQHNCYAEDQHIPDLGY